MASKSGNKQVKISFIDDNKQVSCVLLCGRRADSRKKTGIEFQENFQASNTI
jgi:hypothetical protein